MNGSRNVSKADVADGGYLVIPHRWILTLGPPQEAVFRA